VARASTRILISPISQIRYSLSQEVRVSTFNAYIVVSNINRKGNTGLGKETVLQLAKHNPSHIFLAARTASKATAAIEEIKAAVPNANIIHLPLDLSSFESVKTAADTFKSSSSRLDVLINNAGIMAGPPTKTAEGYEIQFGTNHMGHALLTHLLLPTLLSTAKLPNTSVRIINLSSEGHNMAPSRSGVITDQEKLPKSYSWSRYGNSKLANLLYADALARHHPEIISVSLHPGVIASNLWATTRSNAIVRYGMAITQPILFSTVAQGTRNQLWCATTPKENLTNGGYYKPVGSLSRFSGYFRTEKMAETLWEYTQKEIAAKGF
jgi:NAD(P)-dependent dehydrogenase (short-subunit alcohol dehydrogenase family)